LFHFEDLNETFYASEFFKTGPQLRGFFYKGVTAHRGLYCTGYYSSI